MTTGIPDAKRLRGDISPDDSTCLLDIKEVLTFKFGDQSSVAPEFIHQNFGVDGIFQWHKDFMPLAIIVNVDLQSFLVSTSFSHSGDAADERIKSLKANIIRQLSVPCELGNGCTPAAYPGDITDPLVSALDEVRMPPSETFKTSSGMIVERFNALDFQGKEFRLWKRVEWLMLWFIESVSQSGHETDPCWEYYLLRKPSGEIMAMSSSYRFPSFSYLSEGFIGDRIRVSQFLSIPGLWNKGYGSDLLRAIADRVQSRNDIDKLTMEDASFSMSSMREGMYLRFAKSLGLFNCKDVSYEEIESVLKVPSIFAKRIRQYLEMNQIKGDSTVNSQLIAALKKSENKYIRKFIDSIEYYDDTVDAPEGESAEEPVNAEKLDKLVDERLKEALLKIERINA